MRVKGGRRPNVSTADFKLESKADALSCFAALLESAGIALIDHGEMPTGERYVETEVALCLPIADFEALRPYFTSFAFSEDLMPAPPFVTVLSVSIDWTRFTAQAVAE